MSPVMSPLEDFIKQFFLLQYAKKHVKLADGYFKRRVPGNQNILLK